MTAASSPYALYTDPIAAESQQPDYHYVSALPKVTGPQHSALLSLPLRALHPGGATLTYCGGKQLKFPV